MRKKILIVEDNQDISQLLVQILQENYEIVTAFSGTEAKLLLQLEQPDLILLDLMLPGMSGEVLLAHIRKFINSQVPILILSAKTDIEGKVDLLKNGADDYITKPFDPDEMVARIEVALRRSGTQAEMKTKFVYQDLVLLPEYRKVTLQGKEIDLTGHEYAILLLLIQSPQKVFSRDVLYDLVWENGYYGENNTVNVHVSNLRKKLKAVDESKDYIQTVYGIGFKLQ